MIVLLLSVENVGIGFWHYDRWEIGRIFFFTLEMGLYLNDMTSNAGKRQDYIRDAICIYTIGTDTVSQLLR
jgi:hypothetical protein